MDKLAGKVAIVTGAARGLGRPYARRLAGLGAKIAVADLDLKSYREFDAEAKDMTGESTVAEIEASGGSALGIELDVRDHEAVDAMVARVVDRWGRVAKWLLPMPAAAGADGSTPRRARGMNLFGTVYCCNAVAPVMKRQRSAGSSRSARLPAGQRRGAARRGGRAPSADGGYAHYGATKVAIAHYTRYLAQDLGPCGITANCIAPGGHRDRAELVALRRLGTVEDCA